MAGAVVAASHNPFSDNGLKLFGPGGVKLDDEVEGALEAELHSLLRHEIAASPLAGADVGSIVDNPGQLTAWAASVAGSVGRTALTGMRLRAGEHTPAPAPLMRSRSALFCSQ